MDKNTAAQAIRRLAVQYQGMVEAADALERIGSLEQHEGEVRARLTAVQADEAKARHVLETIEQAARDADAEQKASRAQTLLEAQGQSEAAIVQSKEIIEGARAKAQELLSAATVESEKLHDLTIREQTAAGQRMQQLIEQETSALARTRAAERAADEAQAKLDSIRASIAKYTQA